MRSHKARSKTGTSDIVGVSARTPRCKSRTLFSRRLPGLPHGPMAEATLEWIAVGFLPAEPLWSSRRISGTALVRQRFAAVVAACGFLGIELDRFHYSTIACCGCRHGSQFLNTSAG